MNKHKQNNQKGAALLIYLLVMVFVIAILMTATYSRLLQSVKRGQSSTDNIAINYEAESEVYDLLARLSGKYLSSNAFPINIPKEIGTTKLNITGVQTGTTQTITVIADRPFASTKLVGVRNLEEISTKNKAEILLGLDCTGSMNDNTTTGNGKTRIANLKAAALDFVNKLPTDGSVKLGVYVFGIDAEWLKTEGGQEVSLSNNLASSQIASAIEYGFDDRGLVNPNFNIILDWYNSKACQNIMNATSVGTAFKFAQDYFKDHKKLDTKQVEVIITDGEPNTRIPDPGCQPSIYCPSSGGYCDEGGYGHCASSDPKICVPAGVQFMGCMVAPNDAHFVYTYVDDNNVSHSFDNVGLRDPNLDAYAVTISLSPNGEAADIFKSYLKSNYYPADKAKDLPLILGKILNDIITKKESITIRKEIPGQ